MPYLVKNIIHYRDYGKHYHRLQFERDFSQQMEYKVGNFGNLVPSDAKLKYDKELDVEFPLFNKVKNTKIIEKIGQKGVLYLELQKGYLLNEIFVEPDTISVDIYYGDGTLVYGFYNAGTNDVIALTLSVKDDIHNAYSKIRAHSTDLEWRQYFIKQALLKPGVKKIQVSDPVIRELMTVDQLADYVQMGKKRLQNLAANGKIPVHHFEGKALYKKSEIDEKIDKNR